MNTTKIEEHPTHGELLAYVRCVDDVIGRALLSIKDAGEREAVTKVHNLLRDVASGKRQRRAA